MGQNRRVCCASCSFRRRHNPAHPKRRCPRPPSSWRRSCSSSWEWQAAVYTLLTFPPEMPATYFPLTIALIGLWQGWDGVGHAGGAGASRRLRQTACAVRCRSRFSAFFCLRSGPCSAAPPTCATMPRGEAVTATFELFIEYFLQSLTIPVWGTLLIGGALCGLVVEAAGRLWAIGQVTETKVFLFGTLRYDPLLRLVAGRSLSCVSASLPGARCEPRSVRGLAGAGGHAQRGRPRGCSWRAIRKRSRGSMPMRQCSDIIGTMSRRSRRTGPSAATGLAARSRRSGQRCAMEPRPLGRDMGTGDVAGRRDILRQLAQRTPSDIGRVVHVIRSQGGCGAAQPGVAAVRGSSGGALPPTTSEIVERRHPYDGFFSVEEVTARFRAFRRRRPVRGAARRLPRDRCRHGAALRPGARTGSCWSSRCASARWRRATPSPWLLEPVAGFHRPGEVPETSARREAAEEAGLAIGEVAFRVALLSQPRRRLAGAVFLCRHR